MKIYRFLGPEWILESDHSCLVNYNLEIKQMLVLASASCVLLISLVQYGRSRSVCYCSMNPTFSLISNNFLEKRNSLIILAS